MTAVRIDLTLRQAPSLRVDLRGLLPATLADLTVAQIEQLPFGHGNHSVPLAEWFSVQRHDTDGDQPALRLVGDCSRFDRIGTGLAAGSLVVEGPAGDYVGAGMTGGELLVHGDAGLLAACE
ncbi:MAG: formylmethanofuran dehydrogenase subunit C, partial [Aquincola sp.]|nr:formylmethanofuran dehydrogenase subunit C [Aquincola sp.]